MKAKRYHLIRRQFQKLIGSLTVEEIISNEPLIEQIKILSGLLSSNLNLKKETKTKC